MKHIITIIIVLVQTAGSVILAQQSQASIKFDKKMDQIAVDTPNTRYYNNGAVKEIRQTVNGKLEGNWKLYHDNGQLKKEGAFINNKEEGNWYVYNKAGILIRIESYKNGLEDGRWKAFYDNGKVKIEGDFIAGKREGTWKTYQENGTVAAIISFENDKRVNTITNITTTATVSL
ncbi:toxin-antitoxin system YwqK family antitoxin [Aquimarina hainanensis]|uniref:Toxin-antitoxin system YwqK family antitoxin n=1 Tax=Aquimarina hainanensis TaxID=1578017 RepID=A0ABW5ND37_9FLAO